MTWDAEGKLATVATGGQTVETNTYDATRLLRKDATGHERIRGRGRGRWLEA